MASNTKNVKLGVCSVFYRGVDLGYTKGGVDVDVKTETHKTTVDQFGKTVINEQIMGRDVMAKVPLAETTIENMVAIMPGASMSSVGGAVAQGAITVATTPIANDTVIVNGATFTFKAAVVGPADVLIGTTPALAAANLAAALNRSTDPRVSAAVYINAAAVVTVKYGNALIYGTAGAKTVDGNAFTLSTGTAGAKVTVSGATLTGGTEPTNKSVTVTAGTGINLLDLAGELRLRPQGKTADDKSEDFIIPLAATAGGLKFAYKLEDERIYDVEFTGYPSANGDLFKVGE